MRGTNTKISMPEDEILSADEVAQELRCSKAHIYNVIRGRVGGVSRLPVIPMGRRCLIRRSTLEDWKRQNKNIPESVAQ